MPIYKVRVEQTAVVFDIVPVEVMKIEDVFDAAVSVVRNTQKRDWLVDTRSYGDPLPRVVRLQDSDYHLHKLVDGSVKMWPVSESPPQQCCAWHSAPLRVGMWLLKRDSTIIGCFNVVDIDLKAQIVVAELPEHRVNLSLSPRHSWRSMELAELARLTEGYPYESRNSVSSCDFD